MRPKCSRTAYIKTILSFQHYKKKHLLHALQEGSEHGVESAVLGLGGPGTGRTAKCAPPFW